MCKVSQPHSGVCGKTPVNISAFAYPIVMTAVTKIADGRRQRTERSRKAMIDAALALIQEGNFAPTAREIAERANVGIRSFFRQFEDMDSLFLAVDAQISESVVDSFLNRGEREGTLEQRLDSLVTTYTDAFETHRNLLVATKSLRWSSQVLKDNYARYQKQSLKNKETWIPEFQSLLPEERQLADAYLSFEMWHRIREIQGMSVADARSVILTAFRKLIHR